MEPENQSNIDQTYNQPTPKQNNSNPVPVSNTNNYSGSLAPSTLEKPTQKLHILIIVILLIFVIFLGAEVIIFLLASYRNDGEKTQVTTLPSPTSQQRVSHYTGSQTINLNDVTNNSKLGSVTRNVTPGLVSHSIQAQLPNPDEQNTYQVWLINSEGNTLLLGTLSKNEQGFYTLNTEFIVDPSEPPFTTFDTMHNTIVVSNETINDDQMETKLLEGTFTQ